MCGGGGGGGLKNSENVLTKIKHFTDTTKTIHSGVSLKVSSSAGKYKLSGFYSLSLSLSGSYISDLSSFGEYIFFVLYNLPFVLFTRLHSTFFSECR